MRSKNASGAVTSGNSEADSGEQTEKWQKNKKPLKHCIS